MWSSGDGLYDIPGWGLSIFGRTVGFFCKDVGVFTVNIPVLVSKCRTVSSSSHSLFTSRSVKIIIILIYKQTEVKIPL